MFEFLRNKNFVNEDGDAVKRTISENGDILEMFTDKNGASEKRKSIFTKEKDSLLS